MNTDPDSKTIEWMALNKKIMECLKSRDNHKFSRYDAFIWLLEHIREGHITVSADGIQSQRSDFTTSYTRLADIWHWSRPTVQKFIEELTDISVITKKRNGNFYVFSMSQSSEKRIII